MNKDFIRLSGTLCIITLIAALLLAGVNKITKEKIELASVQAQENAMKSIMPQADDFKKLSDTVTQISKNKKTIGYCVNVTTGGFGGDINMIVGINTDETLAGIEILSHSETPGLGAKSVKPEFKDQFKKKSIDINVVKTKTDSQNEVQAITGATITSRAVTEGVKKAVEEVVNVKGGSN